MGRVAVDTNVLIAAIGPAVRDVSAEASARATDAKHLLDGGGEIIVPAPAWFEVVRRLTPAEQAPLKTLAPSLRIEPADVGCAERAAELLRAVIDADFCPKCLNEKKLSPCSACGASRPSSARIIDAMIVAVGEAHRCATLYTYDEKLDAFSRHTRMEIAPPPRVVQQSLFAAGTDVRRAEPE